MTIIKLGGSVIQNSLTEMNPQIFDFIEKIKKFNSQVVITTGGGKVCRLFQEPLKKAGIKTEDIHRVGVRTVCLQAEYVKGLLPEEERFPVLIDSDEILKDALNRKSEFKYFASGSWKVGNSSDYEAVVNAVVFGADTVVRISNIDYVYDKDPRTNPDAKKLEKVSWDEYLDIIGNPDKHDPGRSYPVDPNTSRYAKEHGIKLYFTSLDNFLSMERLDLENFEGTVIG